VAGGRELGRAAGLGVGLTAPRGLFAGRQSLPVSGGLNGRAASRAATCLQTCQRPKMPGATPAQVACGDSAWRGRRDDQLGDRPADSDWRHSASDWPRREWRRSGHVGRQLQRCWGDALTLSGLSPTSTAIVGTHGLPTRAAAGRRRECSLAARGVAGSGTRGLRRAPYGGPRTRPR